MVQVWNQFFVDQAGSMPPMLAALILMIGVIILLLGWRLSRLVAVLDFSLFGLIVGASLAPHVDTEWLAGGTGAVAFGALALWLDRHSEMIAGGMTAGVLAAVFMSWMEVPLPGMLLAMVAAFACAVSFCAIAEREATAVTTALQGGVLAAFGLASCLASHGAVWYNLREVLAASNIALIMFLLAPIGIGVTFQLAAIQNEEVVAH